MSNPSKQKGTAFEVSLLPALRRLDSRVERAAPHGSRDVGDFTGVRAYRFHDDWQEVVVSAKNCKAVDLSGWIKEAEQQRKNAKASAAIVIHKRRGTTIPEEQYVTLTLGTLISLLT